MLERVLLPLRAMQYLEFPFFVVQNAYHFINKRKACLSIKASRQIDDDLFSVLKCRFQTNPAEDKTPLLRDSFREKMQNPDFDRKK